MSEESPVGRAMHEIIADYFAYFVVLIKHFILAKVHSNTLLYVGRGFTNVTEVVGPWVIFVREYNRVGLVTYWSGLAMYVGEGTVVETYNLTLQKLVVEVDVVDENNVRLLILAREMRVHVNLPGAAGNHTKGRVIKGKVNI